MTTKARQTPDPLTITLSENAVAHIRDFASDAGKPGANLRV